MAAITAAAITGATAIGSAAMQNRASNKAAGAARDASNQANALQTQMYDNTRADLNPYVQAGTGALSGLNALAAGDYSAFQNSPDYQFALQQGVQGVDRSAAARGSLYSGGQQADLTNFAQGMASQQLGSYRNNLMSLAGMGQSAAGQIAGAGQGYANAYGQNVNNAADAQGSNALTQGNNWSQLLAGFGGVANNYAQANALGRQSSFSPGSTAQFGNNLANFKGWV